MILLLEDSKITPVDCCSLASSLVWAPQGLQDLGGGMHVNMGNYLHSPLTPAGLVMGVHTHTGHMNMGDLNTYGGQRVGNGNLTLPHGVYGKELTSAAYLIGMRWKWAGYHMSLPT